VTRPPQPQEETQVIRRQIGYSWSYSFESGPSGDRQKLVLTGNTEGMARALTELKQAKINLMKFAEASVEELSKPPEYEGYKRTEREPLY